MKGYRMTGYEPLPRDEVIKAIEHRGPARVPVSMARWWGEGLRRAGSGCS